MRRDLETVVDATAEDGDDDLVAIFIYGRDDDRAALLFDVKFQVGEKIAKEARAVAHAEGPETVARFWRPGRQRQLHFIGIDEKHFFRLAFRIEVRSHSEGPHIKSRRQIGIV